MYVKIKKLLFYLLLAFVGYYLNSIPIIGFILSPLIFFLLNKVPGNNKRLFTYLFWIILYFPVTLLSGQLDRNSYFFTSLNEKYEKAKNKLGRLTDHFTSEINYKKMKQ